VDATEGAQLVLASAGSGKTRILTERIRYLLEHRKGHFKGLGLTFTNRAAEEMRDRLSDILDLSDKTYIGTVHSFCQMVIESHGHTIGYERPPVIMERESDRLSLLVAVHGVEMIHFSETPTCKRLQGAVDARRRACRRTVRTVRTSNARERSRCGAL